MRNGFSLRDMGNDWHEVVTPFLNHRNDMIELYLKRENDEVVISDGGNTLNELALSGLEIQKTNKRTRELENVLRSFGISKNERNELCVKTSVKKFPETKHRLIQAVLSIDDMFMVSSPRVESFFIEDTAIYFDLNQVSYIKDTSFSGKSGFIHKFDFALPRIGTRKETAVKAINKPKRENIIGALWMVEDTRTVRPDTDGLIILNDENGVAADVYQALKEYNVKYLNWSDRSDVSNRSFFLAA